jgi:hypothetical protein
MFDCNFMTCTKAWLLAGALASGIFVSPAGAQTAAPAAAPPAPASPSRYGPNRLPRRADMFYRGAWGIEEPGVRLVESGEMIRFTYRVVDGDKAKALNDKKSEPSLIDMQAGVRLVVPQMDQVGQLRQSGSPEVGRSYWMAFSNSGRRVKKGDRVDVVIGQFRATGLIVE